MYPLSSGQHRHSVLFEEVKRKMWSWRHRVHRHWPCRLFPSHFTINFHTLTQKLHVCIQNFINFKSKISHQRKTEEINKWYKYNINKAWRKHIISQPQQVPSLSYLLSVPCKTTSNSCCHVAFSPDAVSLCCAEVEGQEHLMLCHWGGGEIC